MKKRNFNPKNYYKLNNLRKKVIKETSKYINLNDKKLLEIGCGNGCFTTLLARKYKTSFTRTCRYISKALCESQKILKSRKVPKY